MENLLTEWNLACVAWWFWRTTARPPLYYFAGPIKTAMLRRLNKTSLDIQRFYFSGWKENLAGGPFPLKFPDEAGSRFLPIRDPTQYATLKSQPSDATFKRPRTNWKFVHLIVRFTRNHLNRTKIKVPCEQRENIKWFPVNEVSGQFFIGPVNVALI